MPLAKTFATATELYSNSQGYIHEGPDACHWCGSSCKRLVPHDDAKPIPGQRFITTAKYPGNTYMCVGCWLWKRRRLTAFFLDGALKDGQSPQQHSWWIEPASCKAIAMPDCRQNLIDRLLQPPRQFALSFVRFLLQNPIHLCPVNNNESIRADLPLEFAVDGKPFSYTVYELQVALKEGPEGTENGVQELCRILDVRKPEVDEFAEDEEKRGRGRPPALVNLSRKVVVKSGR